MKKSTSKMFRLFVCVFMVWGLVGTQVLVAAEANQYGRISQELTDYFNNLYQQGDFTGSVLIAKEGKVMLQKGFGKADYEKGQVNTPETVFAIASMSKAFTAVSIMMLEERGLLELDDKVSEYIPEYPLGDDLTIENLLNMTAGVPGYVAALFPVISQYHTPEELLEYFLNEPPDFEPGSQWAYCNSCYVLLGVIVERVSGMSYGDFLTLNIFDPLGMEHTFYDGHDLTLENKRAVGYSGIRPPVQSMLISSSNAYSAGGIFSTVKDMYKWDQALYTEKLVSAQSLEKIFSSSEATSIPGLGHYGYGWIIGQREINGQLHREIWHDGGYVGFESIFVRYVDEGVTIILLANRDGIGSNWLTYVQEIAGVVFE